MSQETLEWLNQNTLIGYTEKRGNAWHHREGTDNHYPSAIPVEDVRRRLFSWKAIEGDVTSHALTEDGVITVTDPERKTIIRPDTEAILGVFKQGYRIHQYDEWLVKNVEALLDADLAIGSAGLLKGGAVAWVQVEMEDTVSTAGVEFRPFLTAATSLDGSLSTTYIDGCQLVVCDNTLTAGLSSALHRFKVKHSRMSMGRMSEARDALGIVHSTADAFSQEIEALTSAEVSDARWMRFVNEFSGINAAEEPGRARSIAETKRQQLNDMWFDDSRVKAVYGTEFGVLQAVNTWQTHVATVKGKSRQERNQERTVLGEWDKLASKVSSVLATV